MKKIFALALALSLSLSLAACGNNSSSGSGTTPPPANNSSSADKSGGTTTTPAPANNVTLKLGFSTNEEDPRALGAKQFKEEVESKTNGAVTIEIYPSGQLGGDADLINSISLDSGTVDIIITDASNFATYEPKMGISALPFQFADFEEAWAFMDSDVEAEAEAGLIPQNMRVLAHYCNGFRCVTNSKGPVESPDDMKGMLIRTPENPVIMATMTAMGANPQPLAFNELYQALNQGTYDAQENPIPVIYNNNLYEVQEYLSVTNHIYSGMCFTIAESSWNKLSADQQTIVADAAKASADYDRELNAQMTDDLVSSLEEAGMKINNPDLAPFAEATSSVLTDNAATYGDLLDKLAAWKANR
jgi:tripartite ATP-independent transporter DctP family solute receptor